MNRESRLALIDDFMLRELPEEGKIIEDETGNNSVTIIKKDYIRNYIQIRIYCECDHARNHKISLKELFDEVICINTKNQKYRYKLFCNSCGKTFSLHRKLINLKTKNLIGTVEDHYDDYDKFVKSEQEELIPERKESKTIKNYIKDFRILLDLYNKFEIQFFSRDIIQIKNLCDQTKKNVLSELGKGFIVNLYTYSVNLFDFIENTPTILKDTLKKKFLSEIPDLKVKKDSKEEEYLDKRRISKFYPKKMRELKAILNKTIGILKQGGFKKVYTLIQTAVNLLEIFKGSLLYEPIKELCAEGKKIVSEFIKQILIVRILKGFINMCKYSSKNKYVLAEQEYHNSIESLRSTFFKGDQKIKKYILPLNDLYHEILESHYNYVVYYGDWFFEKKNYKKAIINYQAAKKLVRRMDVKDTGPRVVAFINLVDECREKLKNES